MKPAILTILISIFSFFASTQALAWVEEYDFEGGTIGQKIDTHPSGGGHWAAEKTVFTDTQAHTGKQSAKATIPAGTTGGKEWGASFKFPTKLSEGDEIWYRIWLYHPANFIYDAEHGAKGLRIRTYSASGAGKNYFNIYPSEKGLYPYNNVDSSAYWNNNVKENFGPKLTGWEAVEMYIKLSATPGKGAFRLWRNGKLLLEDTKTRTLELPTDYISGAIIYTLWSNNFCPVTQSSYFDDVILTNEIPSTKDAQGNPYIGIGDAVILAPPKPPTVIN